MAVGRGFQGPKFEFQSQFVELPLDFMQKQLDVRGKAQEASNAILFDAAGKKIGAHQFDLPGINRAKEIKGELESEIGNLSGQDLTSPGMVQKVMSLKNKTNKYFSEFGDADTIQKRAATIDNTLKSYEDKELNLPSFVKDFKKNELLNTIQNTPVGQNIPTPGAVKHIDANKTIDDYVKNDIASSIKQQYGITVDPTEPEFYRTVTDYVKELPMEKLLNTAYNKLKADYQFQDSIKQEAQARSGNNPEVFKALVQDPLIKDKTGRIVGTTDSLLGNAFAGVLGRAYKESSRTMDWKVNDAVRRANQAAEQNVTIPITTSALISGFGSEFKTPTDISDTKDLYNQANDNILEKAKNVSINGEKVLTSDQLRVLEYAKQGYDWAQKITGYKNATPEQKQLILGYLAELNQNSDRIKKINEIDKQAKKEAGLENYTVPTEIMEKAEQKKQDILSNIKANELSMKGLAPDLGSTNSLIRSAALDKIKWITEQNKKLPIEAEKAKQTYLQENDKNYKKYGEILKKNSENYTQEIGLTNLPTKSLQETLAANLTQDIATNGITGVRTLKDNKELETLSDYADITNVDPSSIRYYFDEGKVKLAFRPKTGKGTEEKQLDFVTVDAPIGVLGHLLKKGQVAKNQVIAKQFLDSTKEIKGSSYELPGTGLKIKSLLRSDIENSPGNPEFEITDGQKTYRYSEDQAIELLSK